MSKKVLLAALVPFLIIGISFSVLAKGSVATTAGQKVIGTVVSFSPVNAQNESILVVNLDKAYGNGNRTFKAAANLDQYFNENGTTKLDRSAVKVGSKIIIQYYNQDGVSKIWVMNK